MAKERPYRAIRPLRIKKGDDLKTIYAKARRAFTAADLQQYTEPDDGIPADEVAAELVKLARNSKPKLGKK